MEILRNIPLRAVLYGAGAGFIAALLAYPLLRGW